MLLLLSTSVTVSHLLIPSSYSLFLISTVVNGVIGMNGVIVLTPVVEESHQRSGNACKLHQIIITGTCIFTACISLHLKWQWLYILSHMQQVLHKHEFIVSIHRTNNCTEALKLYRSCYTKVDISTAVYAQNLFNF